MKNDKKEGPGVIIMFGCVLMITFMGAQDVVANICSGTSVGICGNYTQDFNYIQYCNGTENVGVGTASIKMNINNSGTFGNCIGGYATIPVSWSGDFITILPNLLNNSAKLCGGNSNIQYGNNKNFIIYSPNQTNGQILNKFASYGTSQIATGGIITCSDDFLCHYNTKDIVNYYVQCNYNTTYNNSFYVPRIALVNNANDLSYLFNMDFFEDVNDTKINMQYYDGIQPFYFSDYEPSTTTTTTTLTTVSTTLTTLAPAQDQVFRAITVNSTGYYDSYISGAAISLVYLYAGYGMTSETKITDASGNVTFSINPNYQYTLKGNAGVRYGFETFYSNMIGSAFIMPGYVPLIFHPIEDTRYVLNVTLALNGNVANCADFEVTTYPCSSSDSGSCEYGVDYFKSGMFDKSSGICYMDLSFDATAPYVRIQVINPSTDPKLLALGMAPLGSTHSQTVALQLAPPTENSLSFAFYETDGSPISNVKYTLTSSSGVIETGNKSGTISITVPSVMYTYTMDAVKGGYAPYSYTQLWDYEQVNRITLTRLANNTVLYYINGTVTDSSDDSPLSGIRVSFGSVFDMTDATGTYHLAGIPSGSTGSLMAAGGSAYSDKSAQISVLSANRTVDFTLDPAGGGVTESRIIRVQVREDTYPWSGSHEYRPLCGADITLKCSGAPTIRGTSAGNDCSYETSSAIDGCSYTLTVEKRYFEPSPYTTTLSRSATEHIATLSRSASTQQCRIYGVFSVINGSVEQGQKDVRIKLTEGDNYITDDMTSSSGRYEFDGVAQCDTQYTVSAEFDGQTVYETFKTKGEGNSEINLKLTLKSSTENTIITTMWDGLLNMWPIVFAILVLFLLVIFMIVIDGL